MASRLPVHALRRFCGLLLGVVVFCLVLPSQVWAQGCYSSSFNIFFGTVSTSVNTDVTATLPYQCQANASNTYYKVCYFMSGGGDADISGINPRRMKDYNGHYIEYNLYSDAARTQVIGPPPSGGGFPVYTWDFMVAGGWTAPLRSLPVYGRVPPVPAGTAANYYQSQNGSGLLQYAWSNSAMPSDCFQTAGGGAGTFPVYVGASATVSNTCQIALNQPANLDFGNTSTLAANLDSTTTINLSCPANTSWRLGLDNGVNALLTQRRMRSTAGDYVPYELYRDSSRSQRWGNDTAGGTDTASGSGAAQTNPTVLTVYGRVPAQAAQPPGAYVDTVTLVY